MLKKRTRYRLFGVLFIFLLSVVVPDMLIKVYRTLFLGERTLFDIAYVLLYSGFGIFMLYLVNQVRMELAGQAGSEEKKGEKRVDEWGDEI